MQQKTTITLAQVAFVASNIQSQGILPTCRAVREKIGSGSMSTVHKLMQQWQRSQSDDTKTIDKSLDPEVTQILNNYIAAKIQETIVGITIQLAQSKVETEEVRIKLLEAELRNEALVSALADAKSKLNTLVNPENVAKHEAELMASKVVAEMEVNMEDDKILTWG